MAVIPLPAPDLTGNITVEAAILRRRSIRRYSPQSLTLTQLSQVLWAAQGITDGRNGLRNVPSAGATYPLEIFSVVGEGGVTGLMAGIYHYIPETHSLKSMSSGDYRSRLAVAALNQRFLYEAPVDIVICAEYSRTAKVYGRRGSERYVPMEAGHAGQNIHLQAESLGLGTVAVGAFNDKEVRTILGVYDSMTPLCIMPLGVPQKNRNWGGR